MTNRTRTNRPGRPPDTAPCGRGFTLMEMMVVIGLISLMAAMALPSIMALLNAGADSQAYNLIAAQLTAARALAIERATFAGIHSQLADAPLAATGGRPKDPKDALRPEVWDVCFTGLIAYNDDQRYFELYSTPERVPGSIAFGKLTTEMGSEGGTLGNSDNSPYSGDAGTKEVFTTLSVVFTSMGSAVRAVNGQPVRFNPNDKVFAETTLVAGDFTGSRRLWHLGTAQDKYGAVAMTMLDMGDYLSAKNPLTYLNDNAQLLPINVHTGQLMPRE